MTKPKVIIYSGFNRKGNIGSRWAAPDWIAKRYEQWKRFTLVSLRNQTVGQWEQWLLCEPGTEDLVAKHTAAVDDPRAKWVFDFEKAKTGLHSHLGLRLDSDDALHPRALELFLMSQEGQLATIVGARGYAFDFNTGRMYDYTDRTPPFYSQRIDPQHPSWEHWDHTTVARRATRLSSEGLYMVGIHGHNSSTHVGRSQVKAQCPTARRDAILREFSLWDGLKAFL